MRIRDLLIIVIGAVVGGGAVLYLTTSRGILFPHATTELRTVRLLVAKQALSYGTVLQPEDLRWFEWPSSAVPSGAFTLVMI